MREKGERERGNKQDEGEKRGEQVLSKMMGRGKRE